MKNTNFITTKDLVEKYGVSRQTVGIWRLKGLNHMQLSPQVIVYDSEEVEQWLKNRGSERVNK